MSTNCICCIVKERTGSDLLCDGCRTEKAAASKKHGVLMKAYRDAAKARYHNAGAVEIDDDADVSLGSSPGAYVNAWLWVPKEDVGT